MTARPLALLAVAALAGCATRSRAGTPAALAIPEGATEYRCESGEQFVARFMDVSAQVRHNGVAYTLPQISNVAGVQSYSDGRLLIEQRQGRTFFAVGRSAPRLCLPR